MECRSETPSSLRELEQELITLASQLYAGTCRFLELVAEAEALAALADRALAQESGGRCGGERYQLVVHVDADALANDDGGCELEEGPALAPESARRLACDASVIALTERGGRTLNVGRKRRTIPRALRRALESRDRRCRFPGCENRLFLDAHHLKHWARGGETRLSNLLLLCRRHHRLVHEGGYTLEELGRGRVRFRAPCGHALPAADRLPRGSPEPLLQHPAKTCWSGTGERMELALVVDELLQAAA